SAQLTVHSKAVRRSQFAIRVSHFVIRTSYFVNESSSAPLRLSGETEANSAVPHPPPAPRLARWQTPAIVHPARRAPEPAGSQVQGAFARLTINNYPSVAISFTFANHLSSIRIEKQPS